MKSVISKIIFIFFLISSINQQFIYSTDLTLSQSNQSKYSTMSQDEILNYILSQTYSEDDNVVSWIEKLYDFAKKNDDENVKTVLREILPYDINLSKEEIIKKIKTRLADLSVKRFEHLKNKFSHLDEYTEEDEDDDKEFCEDMKEVGLEVLKICKPIFYAVFIDNEKLTKYFLENSKEIEILFLNKLDDDIDSFYSILSHCMYLGVGRKTLKLILDYFPNVNMNRVNEAEDFEEDDLRLIDVAILWNYKDIVEILFKRGGDFYPILEDEFECPLYNAVQFNNFDMVRFFIENGINPSYRRYANSKDLVHLALKFNYINILKYLINMGDYISADFIFYNDDIKIASWLKKAFMLKNLSSSLHIACLQGDIFLVENLLKDGFSPNISDIRERTPLHFILENLFFIEDSYRSDFEDFKYFCSDKSINDYVNIIELLIEYGADVNIRDINNNTPALLSVKFAHDIKILNLLIDNGANLKIINENKESVLSHLASRIHFNYDDITKLNIENLYSMEDDNGFDMLYYLSAYYGKDLFDRGWFDKFYKPNLKRFLKNVDLNKTYFEDNVSVLHIAAGNGNNYMVKFYIENGFDVNIKDSFERTPLIMAIYFQNYETVKLLLSLGADPRIEDIDHKTAKDYSLMLKNNDIYNLLSANSN